MVPPYSDKVSRAPPYFSLAQYHTALFTYRTITCYGQPFHAVPLRVVLSLTGFSDFARHYFRNLGWFLFLELLRCFSSPGSPPIPMNSVWDTFRWVSPFGHLRIKAYLPAPRSFSQAITSFIAYHCQGIHHMLLFTWPYNFDVSTTLCSIVKNKKLSSRNVLFGLSPNALCRINLRLISYTQYYWANDFFEIESCLTQSKNLLLTPFKARSALKPLRIVRFP